MAVPLVFLVIAFHGGCSSCSGSALSGIQLTSEDLPGFDLTNRTCQPADSEYKFEGVEAVSVLDFDNGETKFSSVAWLVASGQEQAIWNTFTAFYPYPDASENRMETTVPNWPRMDREDINLPGAQKAAILTATASDSLWLVFITPEFQYKGKSYVVWGWLDQNNISKRLPLETLAATMLSKCRTSVLNC